MATILDYLDWRGDLTFAQSPFNEVDNYILCKLGCPDFTGIIPADGTLSIGEAVSRFDASLADAGDGEFLGPLASPVMMNVIRRLPRTARFGSLTVADFISKIDPVAEEQFSALTILLPDGTRFVTYRGTGDTIISWKEDFLLSVEDVVPAQKDAAAYLLREASYGDGPLMLGGHSKGGNLAVYAALKAPEAIQARITGVYNNDGPGFRRDPRGTPEYARIKPVLHTLVSQHTVIGKLLYHEEDCIIVKCWPTGIAAHDGFNWEVLGTQFVRSPDYSFDSKAFEVALNETLEGMNDVERRDFVEDFFSIMTSTGATTLSDFNEHRFRQALELGGEMRRSDTVRKFLQTTLNIILQETIAGAKAAIPHPRLPFLSELREERGGKDE